MSAQLPAVGTLVRDEQSGKTGVVMAEWAGEVLLRPEGGGVEWAADPDNLIPAGGES